MSLVLIAGIFLLAFANGANDNFKGVATLWGTGRYGYRKLLIFATICALAGSAFAIYVSAGLVKVFSGGQFLSSAASLNPVFPTAVGLGAAATVLLATWLGAPISTTHALTGALLGAGAVSGGIAQVKWATAASSIALPLLVSPLLAVALTLGVFPLISRWLASRNCICVTEPEPAMLATAAAAGVAMNSGGGVPAIRLGAESECEQTGETTVSTLEESIHWTSAGAICFSRTMNDTPKIAALVLTARLAGPTGGFLMVGALMAVGGLVAAKSVARTMSQKVTKIDPIGGMSANLVAALLVGVASRFGVPVSTTHVTMGGIFGVGLRRREQTNWKMVTQIVLAWLITMPIGLICGSAAQFALSAAR
ncbi:MAG TPA: anion permease [Bryobacteraceae bacterium]|jgi:PiT family inorganic phosphate transporter